MTMPAISASLPGSQIRADASPDLGFAATWVRRSTLSSRPAAASVEPVESEAPGVAVGSGVGVGVTAGVGVAVDVGVAVGVAEGVGLGLGDGLSVGWGVSVGSGVEGGGTNASSQADGPSGAVIGVAIDPMPGGGATVAGPAQAIAEGAAVPPGPGVT